MFEEKYYELINKAKSENRNKDDGIFELHHILPRSLGGSDEKENLVLLTPEEHYQAHYYLWKFTNAKQMACAFWFMCIHKGNKISKEEYAELRKQAALASSERHKKSVYNLELDKFFDSCQDACIAVTGSKKNSQYIGQVCNKQHKAVFEWHDGLRYHWCWAEEAEDFKKNKEELLYEEAHRKELTNKNISKAKKGKLAPNSMTVLCVELNKTFRTLKEAAMFCGGNYSILKSNAIEGYPYCGYHWILKGFEAVELKEKRNSNFKGKHLSEESKKKISKAMTLKAKIYCVELDKIFENSTQAASYLNKSSGSYILESIRKNKICYGYHWELIPLKEIEKKIRCIELNKEFNTYKEAVGYIGKSDSKYLKRSIDGKYETCYGYHWELIEKNCEKTMFAPKKLKQGKKGIKIKCIETNNIFNSLSEAVTWLGLSISSVRYLNNCTINGKPYQGYHWELIK